MDALEANTHSFIVKVWLEESADENGRVLWRGHITHVTSGERRYFRHLDQISDFIGPYLARMGVKLRTGWSLKYWLRSRQAKK